MRTRGSVRISTAVAIVLVGCSGCATNKGARGSQDSVGPATSEIKAEPNWLTRSGLVIGLLGIAVSAIGGATSPPTPGRPPDIAHHMTASALLVILGAALTIEGARQSAGVTPREDDAEDRTASIPNPADEPEPVVVDEDLAQL